MTQPLPTKEQFTLKKRMDGLYGVVPVRYSSEIKIIMK